jgi:uncharacterized protein
MRSARERFWDNDSFAFVGHSAKKPFPKLSFEAFVATGAKGRKVFAVDPSVSEVNGSRAYDDLASLPEKVSAVVLEVPREETARWVSDAADAGIENIWIHMGRDTPEALATARARGLNVQSGGCAVMYVKQGPSYHAIHRGIEKVLGRY